GAKRKAIRLVDAVLEERSHGGEEPGRVVREILAVHVEGSVLGREDQGDVLAGAVAEVEATGDTKARPREGRAGPRGQGGAGPARATGTMRAAALRRNPAERRSATPHPFPPRSPPRRGPGLARRRAERLPERATSMTPPRCRPDRGEASRAGAWPSPRW